MIPDNSPPIYQRQRLSVGVFICGIARVRGVYATYGAVYIATALGWPWIVDGVTLTWSDYLSVGLALSGAGVIALGSPR